MALAKCRECGKEVSAKAKTCPNCGVKKPVKKSVGIIGGILVVGLGIAMIKAMTQSPPPPVDPVKKAQDDAQFAKEKLAAAAIASIKGDLRNPASFALASVFIANSGATCIEYRAQNGFGGMSIATAVLAGDRMLSSSSAWNARCANKPGIDVKGEVSTIMEYSGQ